ncbi:MAG: type II secretion system secretin GspD [Betaproteobacteria bacterium]|nr:type II secretion system secretin GspD [Betaproteobacteria bacterium]
MTIIFRTVGAALLVVLFVSRMASAAPPAAPPMPLGLGPVSGRDLVSLNFVDADIEGVIKAVGEAIGKNILVDPRVKGTISLTSDKPLSHTEALATLTAALRLQGYALVEGPGFYRVVPEADAKLQGGRVTVDASGAGGSTESAPVGDQIITQVFRLKYESANNLVPVLRPLIAPNNTITAYPANNTLVITDYSGNLRRIAHIVAAIDAPLAGDVDVIPIKYGLAIDIAAIINRMSDTAAANTDPSIRTVAVPEPRTNSILLKAATVIRAQQIKSLIAKLDTPTTQPGNIWVIPLKNAEATKLAKTLRGIVSGETSASTPSDTQPLGGASSATQQGGSGMASPSNGATPSATSSGQSSTSSGASGSSGSFGASGASSGARTYGAGGSAGSIPAGMIQADATTNSIIITANEQVYRNLRAVIDRLDARRAQIYVESMIVEVSSNKADEFGVQLQGLLGGGSTQTFAGTNFNAATPGSNIVALGSGAGNLLNLGATANVGLTSVIPSAGTNIAVLHNFNGVMGLSALARAVSNISGVNVLSTPNLLTLDNEEANIVIAENIPLVAGQYAQTGVTGTINPFTTVDRKDVGLTLRIKPQISEGGLVRLQIYQESSAVDAATVNNVYGPSYTKRSLESNVLVEDGQVVALGGLLSDSYSDSMEKTPFLGDIPFLGALFRYETKTRVKTNLMVFLRPYVVRTAEQSDALTNDRYGMMKEMRDDYQPNVRILSNETLTPLPPAQGAGSPFVAPGTTSTEPTATPLPGGAVPSKSP